MKHAPGAPIDIIVQGNIGTVSVDVVNGPARFVALGLASAGGGHGLAGMRERAARCGGTFHARSKWVGRMAGNRRTAPPSCLGRGTNRSNRGSLLAGAGEA